MDTKLAHVKMTIHVHNLKQTDLSVLIKSTNSVLVILQKVKPRFTLRYGLYFSNAASSDSLDLYVRIILNFLFSYISFIFFFLSVDIKEGENTHQLSVLDTAGQVSGGECM